jgi:adenine-specific DNA-methyltransferase
MEVFDTPKPENLLERIIHIATNPGELVVDIFGGSGTTATTAHKMRRRWILAERSTQTVLDFIVPRLERVIDGTDGGGITPTVSWKGGGSFETVHVSPRFGTLTPPHRAAAVRKKLEARLTAPLSQDAV